MDGLTSLDQEGGIIGALRLTPLGWTGAWTWHGGLVSESLFLLAST